MSFITTAPTGVSLCRAVAVLGTTAVASLGLTGVAAASEPTYVAGNPTCASVGSGLQELKIDNPREGRSTSGGFRIDITGRLVDFTATTPVDAVIVKGGDNALVYQYNEATSGFDLHAPVNPSNGQFFGVSHVTFCWDEGTPPPPPADPCEGNPNGTKANGEPCTPVIPPQDPCEADPNGTKANGEPCTPPVKDPCDGNPGGTMANGEPCTPPVKDPCDGNPGGTMANGEPCTPPVKDPCDGNPGGTMANGQPCTPPEVRREEPQREAVAAVAESTAPAAPVVSRALSATSRGRVAAARASIIRPRRCVTTRFSAVVRGTGIRRVTMYVNGKKVRTMAGGRTRYALSINPAKVNSGVIRVKARVEYVAASGKRAQTLSMTALRCQVRQAAPQFAG